VVILISQGLYFIEGWNR